MAILAECNRCHRKQRLKNKRCKCSNDLDAAKRSQKICYHVKYRMPGGKQRQERVGFSLKDAQAVEGKRLCQKRENRILEIQPEAKITLIQLATWYLGLDFVKAKKSFDRDITCLNNFNAVYGNINVGDLTQADLANYQIKRKKEGKAAATIDMEISIVKTMINRAFDNNKVGIYTWNVIKKCKKTLKKNTNVRDRILSVEETRRLLKLLPLHTFVIVAIALCTGMRKGEILSLTWDKVDMKGKWINLDATDTKDKEPRKIPISDELYPILESIPRAIHDNHVILYNGKPIKKDIRASLYRACEKAGIIHGRFKKGGFIFHDSRHTFNTNMRKAGVDQSVIMDITGHSTNEMFQRYNTVDDDDKKKAMNKMGLYLESVDQNVDHEPISVHEENKKV